MLDYPPMEEDLIQEGKYVVVQKVGGETFRVSRVARGTRIVIEKLRFDLDGCIGRPFGMFAISGVNATPVPAQQLMEELRQESLDLAGTTNGSSADDAGADKTSDSDSKDVVDETEPMSSNQAQAVGQAVTQEEVLGMKSGGTTAKQLVGMLVKGNKGFVNRTEYAQSKYVRRKMAKHSDRILVLKPTIRLLANSYYTKDTDKFGMLRIGHLGLLLQMGHIVHNRNVLVFDQIQGIVTAAIIERLAGNGACIHLHRGNVPQGVPCLHAMNFDEESLAPYLPVRISKLLGVGEPVEEPMEAEEPAETTEGSLDKPVSSSNVEDANVKRQERLAREQRGLGFIASGVDSLIIASRSVDLVDILKGLFPKLKPSGAVACYHSDLQAVIRAQHWLMDNHCLNVNLSEQMYRVHQVLPDRTHPLMAQHIAGGYVLSGIKVLPPPPQTE